MMKFKMLGLAALGLSLCSLGLLAQDSQAGKKQELQGKTSRIFSKSVPSRVSGRKINFKALVVDPAMAAKLSEEGPKILTNSEYEDLKERKSNRLKNRMGRALSEKEASYIHQYEGEASKRKRLVKNEDAEDDSFKFLIWLIGGVSAVGGVFYFWRRHL